MGRPRKDATAGGKARAVTDGSLNSPIAGTEIVRAGPTPGADLLRRSGRLTRSLQRLVPNKTLHKPMAQNVTLLDPEPNHGSMPDPVPHSESTPIPVPDNEKTGEETENAPNVQEKNPPVLPTATMESMESKIDFLVESVKEFKSEGVKRASPEETQAGELSYKSMYFEARKKIEELEDEVSELSKDYEVAQAKVDMLQQINVSLQNLNNVSLVSNFGKATEAIVSLAAQGRLNVPEEADTRIAPSPAPAQVVAAAAENTLASPPARRNTKRTR